MLKPLVVSALVAAALVAVASVSNDGTNIDQENFKSEYCHRVDMYEIDVTLGKAPSDIRGHRDFKNICN